MREVRNERATDIAKRMAEIEDMFHCLPVGEYLITSEGMYSRTPANKDSDTQQCPWRRHLKDLPHRVGDLRSLIQQHQIPYENVFVQVTERSVGMEYGSAIMHPIVRTYWKPRVRLPFLNTDSV